MLCEKCATLPIHGPGHNWTVPHYSTYIELDESSKSGCNVCTLFKTVTLDYYADSLSCTIDEADRHHRSLDRLLPRANISEVKNTLLKDFQKGHVGSKSTEGVDDGEDKYDEDDEDKGENDNSGDEENVRGPVEAFFVRAGSVRIDSDFAGPAEGLHSLQYIRRERIDSFGFNKGSPPSNGDVVGRPIPNMAEYALATNWINDCRANHEKCSPNNQSQLPTRVLDLGNSESEKDVRLAVNLVDKAPYATLSHCWGSSRPLQLTLANYDQLQTGIPYASLNKTFQDAVTATRALGLRYLWIDSLCIIQDSKHDWEEQCTNMAQIYSGSIVTIAGPAAPDANSGFIFPRNTPRQAALELIGDNNKEKYILSHSGILRSPYRVMPEEKSPLAQRGWVLQERLLSQRTLYFGSHNMYLECFTNVRFDSCYYPIRWHYQTVNMAEKKLIMPLEDANARFQYWLQIITTYGQTLLSKPTDKLPALSALASEFHRATGCRYLAGVWQEDLYRMLTWYTHYFLWQDEPSPRHISQEYVAPSWSWASANHILGYMNLNYEMRLHTSMDIIEVKVTPSGIDPFGTVKDGYLRVRGKSRPAVLSVDPHPKIPSKRRLQVLSETSASELLGRYNPDYGNAVPSSGSRLTLLYLGWFDLGRTDRKSAVALAIEPYGPRQGAYKRVGLACTETLESGDSLIGYFDGVEREEFLIY